MHYVSSSPSSLVPGLVNLEAAQQRFGKHKVELLLEMRQTGDGLMDAVMREIDISGSQISTTLSNGIKHGLAQIDQGHTSIAVRALLEKVESVPEWVDPERLKKGSDAYLSIGNIWITLALGPGSLVHTYSSPSIAHVLVQTGNLVHMARRRLIETGLWEIATILPGGLTRGADGYIHNLQVRLLHARVRHTLLKRGWDVQAQGMPINQIEMARTWLDFTSVPFNALQRFGIIFTNEELEDLYHFWRYVAYLLGIDERLYQDVTNQDRASELLDLIDTTMPGANEDSKLLTHAMLDALVELLQPSLKKLSPRLRSDLGAAITRQLHGNALANQLGVKKTWMSMLMPLLTVFNRIQRARLRRNPQAWRKSIDQTIKTFHEFARIGGITTYQRNTADPRRDDQQLPQTVDDQ